MRSSRDPGERGRVHGAARDRAPVSRHRSGEVPVNGPRPARTHSGFTLVVCMGCLATPVDSWLDELRAVVRLFPHGMLVSAACLLGSSFCTTRPGGGAVAMLQPCAADRRPVGPAHWIGPILDEGDLADLCDWLLKCEWSLRGLPARLRHPMRQSASASRRN